MATKQIKASAKQTEPKRRPVAEALAELRSDADKLGSALADRRKGAEGVRNAGKAILAELEKDFPDIRNEIVPALTQRAELCGVRGYRDRRAIIMAVWKDSGIVERGERENKTDTTHVPANLRTVIVALGGSSSTSRTPAAANAVGALLKKFAGFSQPADYRAVSALLARVQKAQSDGFTIDNVQSDIETEHAQAITRLPQLWDLARAIEAAAAA
jgi:hypothetical protein